MRSPKTRVYPRKLRAACILPRRFDSGVFSLDRKAEITQRIAIGGLWHQGVVLCAGLASLGNSVVGLCDAGSLERLGDGVPLVHEPGLAELLRRQLGEGRLRFTTDVLAATDVDFFFVSHDTPVDDRDVPVLGPVEDLVARVAGVLTARAIVCVTAQVPVGTTHRLQRLIEQRSRHECGIAYVPEFLRLGSALGTFFEADRFVIGCDDETVAQRVLDLFAPLGRPLLRTGVRTAEMAKHASNAFLATSISFVNEIADICEAIGARSTEVAEIMRLDRRIGPYAYLSPGLGFAGATLGRDVRALQQLASENGLASPLADAVVAVNTSRVVLVERRLSERLGGLEGANVTLYGLTYKPGTSTLRRSLGLDIAARLAAAGACVRAFDPLADVSELDGAAAFPLLNDPYEAARGADALVLLTEWEGVQALDLPRLRRAARHALLFDTRNALPVQAALDAGFELLRVGDPGHAG